MEADTTALIYFSIHKRKTLKPTLRKHKTSPVRRCENTLLQLWRDRDRNSITLLTRERKSIDLVSDHELERDKGTKHLESLTLKLFTLKIFIKH